MKVTYPVMIKRLEEIVNLLINGESREAIVQYSSDNWSIGERQADKYIAKAREVIELSVKRNVSYDYAKAVRRYEELYKRVISNGELRTAVLINKELATLQGLYKLQIEHSGNVQFICNLPE